MIDIDDTVKPVFGARKQGSQFGYTKVRGLNAQLATISTDHAAPVIAATRLRRGARNGAAGAVRIVRDTITTARRCGAVGSIVVRSDSAYCSAVIIAAITASGARFSVGIGMNPNVRRAIAAIHDTAWTRIEYPQAIPDPQTGELVSAAEVAEITYTAFTSKPKDQHVTARLIVRRIPELNKSKLAGQDPLFPVFRYHAIFTDNPADLITAEAQHRGHAVIEQVIADLNSALAHLPSGRFTANAAWLVAAAIAFNLTRALGVTAAGRFTKATTATIRTKVINIPARIARSARNPVGGQETGQIEPGRTGLIDGSGRTGQLLDPRQDLRGLKAHTGSEHFTGVAVDRGRDHRPCVHIQTNTRTLNKHWGLPQLVALPDRPQPARQPTNNCERCPSPHWIPSKRVNERRRHNEFEGSSQMTV